MNFLKYIFLIFFTIFLFLLYISWHLFPKGISFIFVLTIILLIEMFANKDFINLELKHILIIPILGSILLDLYSIYTFGIYFFSFIFVFYICYYIVLQRFGINYINVMVIGIITSIIYRLLFLFFNSLYYVLKLHDIKIVLNKFYFLNFLKFIILNTLCIYLIFFLIDFIKNKYKKLY